MSYYQLVAFSGLETNIINLPGVAGDQEHSVAQSIKLAGI